MSDLDRRRLMMGRRKIPDFIIFDGALKAGRVLGKSYSSISSAGYINICGGVRSIGGGFKGYSADAWSKDDAEKHAAQSGYEYSSTQTNSSGHTTYIFKKPYEGTREYSGYLTIGNYDFNKYKKLKIQVSSAPGSGTLTILNGSNNNVLTQNIYSSREYSIDIKNLNAVYSLKFESSGKDGFNIRKIYLEG